MKSRILTLAALFLAVSVSGVFAQSQADVAVTAQVETPLTLTPTDVQFGTIQANAVSYLKANTNDGTEESNIGATASAGALQIQGSAGVDVKVSWTNATLTDLDGENPAIFTPTVYNDETLLTSGDNDVTLTGGNITLDIGGQLAAISEQGSYSTGNGGGSPVTFTVEYN